MKKLSLSTVLMMFLVVCIGQVPQKFNYQAVVRNADGTVISNESVNLSLRIYKETIGGELLFEEFYTPVTNEFGLINIVVGEQVTLNMNPAEGPFFLEASVNGNPLGATEIVAVPFALYANEVANNADDDADPLNEIQDLNLQDNVLTITGNPNATPINLAQSGDSQWLQSGDSVYIVDQHVGIGTKSPTGKLVVMGDGTEAPEEPLFEVKKSDGQTVFAVYNDGTEVIVNDNPTKGKKGGFAVGGYSNDKKGATTNFMYLTPENYFIGHEGGLNNTLGLYNSTLGYQAGAANTEGDENIFIGYQSGMKNTTGNKNTFIGYQAGYNNTLGFENIFMGYRAGHANITGQNNLFLGFEAGYFNTTGNFNMFLGYRAGTLNTTGQSNMFIGYHAGRQNTNGSSNMFIGPGAGFANTIGNRNIFIGFMSGTENRIGSSNLFFGEYAGFSNTDGFYNIFIGTTAGGSNTSGARNVFIGDQSGYVNTTGYQNTFMGHHSGYSHKDGFYNVFLGFESGYKSNGYENVYLGSRAGHNNLGSHNIFIGNGAGGFFTDSISNTLVIHNSGGVAPENALIYGRFDNPQYVKFTGRVGIWREPLANRLEVEGSASKTEAGDWLANSDARIKREISELEDAFEVMLQLRPVKFKYTDEYKAAHPGVKDKYYYNFVAQEYQEVFPESVQSSGELLESAQDEILQMDSYNAQIYSIKAVQELILENQAQAEKIGKQQEQINELYRLIGELSR
ncbi:MAG: tail fiber domain-containing protein [Bacteroidota bacterium]